MVLPGTDESDSTRQRSQSERLRRVGADMIRLLYEINEENGHFAATHETTLAVQKVQEAIMWGVEAIQEA